MKRFIIVFILIVLVSLVFGIICFSFYSSGSLSEKERRYREAFARHYKIFSVEIPEKLEFAGEPVPLENYYVRESLDRELLANTYWHSNSILMFKRSLRWFPVIMPVLKKNNIPEDFIFLCMIESAFDNVVSPAGAAGYWQFLKSTGQLYGLEINHEVDERYHVEKATEAACKFLKEAYDKFKSWTLAAAAFNMGMDGLSNQMKIQKTDNYYDLQLNRETLRYIYRILAVKVIFQHPVKYGFYLRRSDFYPPVPTRAITVDTTIADLADFARKHGVSYRTLKELNPWLLKNSLTNKDRKKYEILLPKYEDMNYKRLLGEWEADSFLFNDTMRIDAIK